MKGGTLPTLIDQFDGPWRFLSNFYPVEINLYVASDGNVWAGNTHYAVPGTTYVIEQYGSVEHAYQAAKFLQSDLRDRFRYSGVTAGQAKRMGGGLKPRRRKDWEQISIAVMRDLLQQKFSGSILKRKLMSTFSAQLIEGNTWHDNFYGDCRCGSRPECEAPGENWLGKLLMELRRSYIS